MNSLIPLLVRPAHSLASLLKLDGRTVSMTAVDGCLREDVAPSEFREAAECGRVDLMDSCRMALQGRHSTPEMGRALCRAVVVELRAFLHGRSSERLTMPEHSAFLIHFILFWGALQEVSGSDEQIEALSLGFQLTDRDGFGMRSHLAGALLAAGDYQRLDKHYVACERRDMMTAEVRFARVAANLMRGNGIEALTEFIEVAGENPFAAEYLINCEFDEENTAEGVLSHSWQEARAIAAAAPKVWKNAQVHYALCSVSRLIENAAREHVSDLAFQQMSLTQCSAEATYSFFHGKLAPGADLGRLITPERLQAWIAHGRDRRTAAPHAVSNQAKDAFRLYARECEGRVGDRFEKSGRTLEVTGHTNGVVSYIATGPDGVVKGGSWHVADFITLVQNTLRGGAKFLPASV